MSRTIEDKQRILLKIAENRALLRLELRSIEENFNPLASLVRLTKQAGPVLASVAALAGALTGRKRKSGGILVGYGSLIAALLPVVIQLLKHRARKS